MKKILVLLIISITIIGCNKNYRVARITHAEDHKVVEVQWGDSIIPDTTFFVDPLLDDSLILKQLRIMEDSLRRVAYQDSIAYIQFQQDSINFRKITRKINGGYNGWEDRYKKWINNRKVLEHYKDTVL